MVQELHEVLCDSSPTPEVYKRYVSSLKNSALTAFYTPKPVTDALMDVLQASGIRPSHFLEPSAGTGTFISSFRETMLPANITAFEKDLLTGKILSHLYPDDKVRMEGYEKMEGRYNGRFDVIASNIPFGDVAVFDPQLSNHEIPAVKQSTQTIHNYFFTKSVQAVREGGIIAFITSQGVLNSEQNKPIREYLMSTCDVVSAIRLPNNLFTDSAGTDVGSDLIILQKNTAKKELSQRQQDFIEFRKLSNGISINNLFRDFSRVVQTQSKTDTDPYGKPAIVFTYEGSTKELTEKMRGMLYEDFARHYNHRLYMLHKRDIPEQSQGERITQERESTAQPDWEENSSGREDVLSDEQLEEVGLSTVQQSQSLREQNQPTQEDMESLAEYAAESDRKLFNERPPQPEDYDSRLTLEDYKEIDTAVKAVRAGKWDEFVAKRPYMRTNTANTPKPEENPKVQPQVSARQEPVLTLYDLFGFSQEERSQVNTKKRGKRTQTVSRLQQLDLFAGQQTAEACPVFDARREKQLERLKEETGREQQERMKPVPYYNVEDMPSHYREGSLVTDENNRIGYLCDLNGFQPMFHPLQLTGTQQAKASLYIEIRDTYHHLYSNEATRLEANPALRDMLNRLYDDFTHRFGNINDAKNLSLIKMDAGGTEILSLERYINGKATKADIFQQPVAFNPNEITSADNAREALTASLNKYAKVNLDYMAGLTGGTSDEILEELKGQVFFNPMIDAYEIKDSFISGNVISKAEHVERYLESHPDHEATKESLAALRGATPRPIPFEDLDFNFGERWIPTGIYSKYASRLFDTNVSVQYARSRDEYTLKADSRNIKIWDQYAVKAQSRTFDGIALMKHALHNTSPDITKKVNKMIDGEMKEVKVRDSESIQLANSKIDEMRNGFTDWLNEQSREFKDRLADKYNRTFNCFVRPDYDGSRQEFPGLDLKGLGISDLYRSQKDAVWMDKLNGGGIIDHEVLRP